MNPENDALGRTYFIGGPPRVGKSALALCLARQVQGNVVSTDSIRDAVKKACTDTDSDFFIINRTENISEEEWLQAHLRHPEKTIEYQNRESMAIWPSIVSFCNSFCDDDAVHVVEGVALLPSLVSEMQHKPAHIVFVGNTSAGHVQAMQRYAAQFPEKDWMQALGYSQKKFEGMANYIRAMSVYFKSESEKYGFPYYEISDEQFQDSIARIAKVMINR